MEFVLLLNIGEIPLAGREAMLSQSINQSINELENTTRMTIQNTNAEMYHR